ncbi:MAG: signal recognition particle-docking protein FtsY [Candidatus Micrarchaeia archaeon]
MFDLLKKKIGGFIDNLVKKEEKTPEIKAGPAPALKIEEPVKEEIELPEEMEPEITVPPEIKKEIAKPEPKISEPAKQKIEEQKKEEPKKSELSKLEPQMKKTEKPEPIIHSEPKRVEVVPSEPKPIEVKIEPKIQPKAPEPKKEEPKVHPKIPEPKEEKKLEPKKEERKLEQKKEEKKPEQKLNIGFVKQLTSIVTGEIEISEKDVSELLEGLELELLESDVAIEAAEEIKNDLKEALTGKKIKRGELSKFVKETIRKTLVRLVTNDNGFDLLEIMETAEKPVKILFLGVNGAGKTTTIAKVAKMLMNNGKTVVFSSSDTFRAAAIEQMQVHADKLGVKNIKRDYGSDPTAVAYDAVNYAKAHGIDAVLIDTAGRQETDLNLINELKKINRVIQPTLKLYIGESIAGNGIISQVGEFNEAVGISGVILTKLDCDAKGGTALSITKASGIPIVYLGIGQKYEDLEKFDAEKMIDRILG